MSKRIGFIGLGVMGAPMARHVAAKYGDLVIFDIDTAKMESLKSAKVVPACSVADVGRQADAVILSLPGSAAVRDVVLADDGLISTMREGSTVIDTSTAEPTVAVAAAEALSKKGISFLDAPVSGGEKGAIDGTLAIMVGGEQDVFEEHRELLGAMGKTVTRLGGTGMGQVAKAANQMIVGATFAIVAESFALAVKSGLDPRVLYEAIRGGFAGSPVLDHSVPAMLDRNFRPGGTVNIHWKDLGYALSIAREHDVPAPITALAHEIFKAARAGGNGALSQPAVVLLWEKLLGIEVTEAGASD